MLRSWDEEILLFAAAHRSDTLDAFFRAMTWLGSLYLLAPAAILLVIVMLRLHRLWEATLLIVGFGVATAWVHHAKAVVGRPRPDLVAPLVPLPTDDSFPSAHTTQIFAFLFCIVLITRRTLPDWYVLAAVTAILVAVIVSVSRIYLQVHFPSDVMAGAILGTAWVAFIQRLL